MEKIIGAFTFRKEVYQEVEKDATFTPTAWMIVAVVAFLSQFGANAALAQTIGGSWIVRAILMTGVTILGFALGAFVISWAGKTFFNADTNFEEMVRVLGLAYVWNIIGFFGYPGNCWTSSRVHHRSDNFYCRYRWPGGLVHRR